MDKKILYDLCYGVYIISTLDQNRPCGCIANSVMQITSDPATCALSMNHNNYTNECIARTGMFAVSILSETSDPSLIGRFGFQSSRDINKFDGLQYETKEDMPIIPDSTGYMVFKVIDQMETSTHTVFLGELVAAEKTAGGKPMTYAYYHDVIKGTSPKNAPTYQEKEVTTESNKSSKESMKFVCEVCGYIHEGTEPPEKCPICGVPASKFSPLTEK